MKTVLKYKNIELKLYGTYNITKSSQDVTYSDISCDFTGHTKEDLPQKYQEVKIVEINDFEKEKILFFGYVEDYDFGEMRETDIELNLNISLYSPKKMSTLRTCIANGTYQLKELLQDIVLVPLIDDGFTVKEMQITDHQVSVNYISETIEYCMNNLSNKFNFWWYINEQKEIFIKDISLMVSKTPNYIYDNEHTINGLEYIRPKTNSDNYANVINFKNVRIFETSSVSQNALINVPTGTIKANDTIDFNYPVNINKENIIKSAKSNDIQGNTYYGIRIQGQYSNGTTFDEYIKVQNGTYNTSSNIGYSGELENGTFLLIRDVFYNDLITGFKYYDESKNIAKITNIYSDSALIWNVNKFYNDNEISDKKNIVSKSGIIETTIDMNESWKTIQELTEIGSSYLQKNISNIADEIEIKIDQNTLEIGKTIYINKMIIKGTYIITKIQELYLNNEKEYLVTAKNGNLLNNFVDVFRGEKSQQSADKTYQLYITHYVEEEIAERFEVVK